jgi:hypothetical protein
MRGRTFNDAICIFDEAQNASYSQLKLSCLIWAEFENHRDGVIRSRATCRTAHRR